MTGFCAVFLVGVVAFAYGDVLATGYYLYRLERNPALVRKHLDGEQSTSIARAVTRFSRTDEGKRALLGVFISAAIEVDQDVGNWLANVGENQQVIIWASKDENLWRISLHFPPFEQKFGSVSGGGSWTSVGELDRRLRNAQEYLGDAGARSIVLARFPDLAFSFRAPGSSLLFRSAGEDATPSYVCVATKAD